MAFPNLMGVVLLSGKVKRDLDDYLARLHAGAFARADRPHARPEPARSSG